MDSLFGLYADQFAKLDGTVFNAFSKFYSLDLSPIDFWLECQFKNKLEKSSSISIHYRQEGNKYYGQKNLLKSLEYYTKSLCLAIPNSKEYGLALANRSAVAFEMRYFKDCIIDINRCFDTDYPIDLKPKIFLRKAESYCESGQKVELEKCIADTYIFLASNSVPDKDKFIEKLKYLERTKVKQIGIDYNTEFLAQEKILEKPNKIFAFASSKIKISYDKVKGRHVIAKKQIQKGETLFLEKAFTFAPVFKDCKELYLFKCYYCLKDVISSMPCPNCTLCIYCNDQCRNLSWEEAHKWECKGMQANIWYHLGIAFPALKTLLKGVESGFWVVRGNHEEDLKCFGNTKDNYPYVSRLKSNIYKSKDATSYIVMAAVVVAYLKNYTEFFTWLLEQKNCPKKDLNYLFKYIGGLITKHIAQISCNSSVIEHWNFSSTNVLFPDSLTSVACGIFPSVSIMNHSCKPNVANYFVYDTIVVKASEDIAQNEEVFNCYGIDYRMMNRKYRQNACANFYNFKCTCVICSDRSKEMERLDSYLCPKCMDLIPEENRQKVNSCLSCGEQYSLLTFRIINEEAQGYLESEEGDQLELLMKSLKIREKILTKYHRDFEEIYYKLYCYYVKTEDVENMFKYFRLWLGNEKAHKGMNSRSIGIKLYEAALDILLCFQKGSKTYSNLRHYLNDIEHMIKEAKLLIELYYPAYVRNGLSSQLECIIPK